MSAYPHHSPVLSGGPQHSVLIVEDQLDIREMMTLYVGFCGYLVHVAADGVEAIDMAVRVNPHIILMDLMMPRMDGLEATRRLKADARTKEITIIALSARSLADQADDGRHAGCDAFMRKPCDLDLLGDVLRDFFERRAHPATATDH